MLVIACGGHPEIKENQAPPEENRFIQEVYIDNLFEPTELVVLPNGKIIFTQRRGGIKQFDPDKDELITLDSVPVYTQEEHGLMGIALDPEFEQNNWVYLYYSPAGDRWIQSLSRFSYTPKGLENEVVILEVPVQRETCCHTGGSIEFGPDGNLYLSTGDDTNPFNSKGYSPSDEREGWKYWDAQRTSSNTNDLRGKILRIKPLPDGSYTIPKGNLFEDDDPKTRPEIYIMGCRNPYRISVDSKRGWLFWGDVGPDAGEDGEGIGPRGYDEFNIARSPGYYGWPLFVGDNFAYHDYDFETGESGQKFNPKSPINSSINNTGLRELPPAVPAKIYYPYAESDVFPQVNKGGRNAMAGPVYYSEEYGEQNKFPSYLDGRVLYYDWIRGFIYFLKLDSDGNPVDWYPFMPSTKFSNIIDIEYGNDGSMYLIEYGKGWFTQNKDAQLSRIRYVSGNRPPILKSSISKKRGAAPLQVTFDASGSVDYDGDKLRYDWILEDLRFRGAKFDYTFEKNGVYYPKLILTDSRGNTVEKQFVIEVGNEPPAIEINIEGNKQFFWKGREVNYSVRVSDLEDQAGNGINSENINFDIIHFQSTDEAEALGHQTIQTEGFSLIESMDCKGCHKIDGSSIGPSFTAVAKRYEGRKDAINYLTYKIIQGGAGVWGEQMMAAHPDLSTNDAEEIVNYILALGREVSLVPLQGVFTTTQPSGNYLFRASYEDGGKEPMQPISVTKDFWLKSTSLNLEDYDEGYEIKTKNGRINSIFHKSWVAFKGLDLTNISAFLVTHEPPALRGATVSIHLNTFDGPIIGSADIYPKSDLGKSVEVKIQKTEGNQDLFFSFENEGEENNLIKLKRIELIPEKDEK